MASIFTRIVEGEIPGTFVYRDDRCVAFMDIEPLTTGHVLVVPRKEIDQWTDLDEDLASHLFLVAQRIGQAQKTAFGCARVGVVIQGYEVPHVHIHVFPSNAISDFDLANKEAADPEALSAAAQMITEALQARA